MATHDDLAAQVDDAFTEQLGAAHEAEEAAKSLMAAFLDAGCTYLNGDHNTAQTQLHQYIDAASNPTHTTINLCVAGAMAVAGCLEHAAPPCEIEHVDPEECAGSAVFDLDAAGNELTYTVLSLCNAAVDEDHDNMAGILKAIYSIGGVKGLATMLAALVELFATTLRDLAKGEL